MSYEGKIAIVTGGGRGLGRAMALALAGVGFQVAITAASSREEIVAVSREAAPGLIHPFLSDVGSELACAALMQEIEDEIGSPDVLINNAGRGMRFVSEEFMTTAPRFWQTDPKTWRTIVATNVNGPFYMSRLAAPGMIRRGWGRIINISMNYETMRRAGFSPYGPSKAALESETVIWAQDLALTGVTVNALLPGGASLTGMIPNDVPDELRGRLIAPEIMVPPLMWLISDAADDVTGKRVDASRWDADLTPDEAAAAAMSTACFG